MKNRIGGVPGTELDVTPVETIFKAIVVLEFVLLLAVQCRQRVDNLLVVDIIEDLDDYY